MKSSSVPPAVPLSKLLSAGLSPKNFAEVAIPRVSRKKLRDFLHADKPFDKGVEPGSSSYVPVSNTAFLRNSCISLTAITPDTDRLLHLNPNLGLANMAEPGDVLLCKDANIGEAALVIDIAQEKVCFSSGIVKLNFKDPAERFFVLAAMRDSYFLDQLYALTPRGSTIRHAGDKFLDCEIPALRENESWVLEAFSGLLQNSALAEVLCREKLDAAVKAISDELFVTEVAYSLPTISDLLDEHRIDAGFYSELVQKLDASLAAYPHGHMSLDEAGFSIRRGPNLAKRDLGRSIICEDFRAGYDVLIYPSDISSTGFLLRSSFIGARGAIWHLGIGDILFSAEGTVGRVFAVCDESMHFTTNFHGMIVSAKPGTGVDQAAAMGMYLHFLREIGWFSKVSVGGQGGSFASSYWHLVRVPRFSAPLLKTLSELYHRPEVSMDPLTLNKQSAASAGIYQLSKLRLQCMSIAKMIMHDLKQDALRPREHYKTLFKQQLPHSPPLVSGKG